MHVKERLAKKQEIVDIHDGRRKVAEETTIPRNYM